MMRQKSKLKHFWWIFWLTECVLDCGRKPTRLHGVAPTQYWKYIKGSDPKANAHIWFLNVLNVIDLKKYLYMYIFFVCVARCTIRTLTPHSQREGKCLSTWTAWLLETQLTSGALMDCWCIGTRVCLDSAKIRKIFKAFHFFYMLLQYSLIPK